MIGSLRGGLHAVACLAALLAVSFVRPAAAQVGSARYASFVLDVSSGQVLEAANADEPRYPASLTKLMTIYMLFEALRDRRVSLDEEVPISAHSASMEPSKLGLVPGTHITVEQALLGLVTKSANDAASALGELMGGGDEDRFAQMMTLRAHALGMTRTTFRNASGLPDPDQVTTARDLALLARHLIQDYPAEYRYFSVPSFTFHRRVIMNHDRMLQRYPGADGMKTGYTDASGCNLVTSAMRGDVRLVGVVLGTSTGNERDMHMASLLDAGFERMGVAAPLMDQRRVNSALMASAGAAALRSPVPERGRMVRPHVAAAPVSRHAAAPSLRLATARAVVPERAAARQPVRGSVAERREVPARVAVRPRVETPPLHALVRRPSNGRSTASTVNSSHERG
jgi:D-alanyl-D-alanine carboxypeptidase